MKKLLSALLIATMLIASVTCMFAVSAEETSPVIYNLLGEIKAADTADVTVVVNDNGTVTITPKRDIDANTPATIVTAFEGGKFDATKQTYLAVDIACEITDIDFRLHYTRKDKVADQFWTGMREEKNKDYAAAKTDTSVVWDITKYLTSDAAKLNDDHMHQYTDLVITVGKKDKPITFNTLALISDASALKPGEPLVKPDTPATSEPATSEPATSEPATSEPATSEPATSEPAASEASSTETTTPAASSSEAPASSSSTAPGTGDTGLIVFAVLAVLAVVGGVAVVRVRH